MKTAATTKTSKVPWHKAWGWLLALLVLLALGIRFAEPVRDGDLWWQMAYGRYLIEHSTLIPDHTIFTWTPAQTATIYCAWIPEIFLYLLHQLGGLLALFSFRYFCLLIFVAAVWLQARRLEVSTHPLTWLICLLGVLMSQSAAFVKPEIFSYVLMTATVFTWWHIKSSGDTGWRYCYLFPVLMVIWVNTHGGFIFGAAFLFVMGAGEALNILLSPGEALPSRVRRHLFIGLFLSVLAIFVTPYGWHYPAYFIPAHLMGKGMEGFKTIRAYTPVFEARARNYHYVDYLFLAGLILVVLLIHQIRHRRVDWAVILTNGAFAFLYTCFLRTTYYWAPVFSLTAVHLVGRGPRWLWPKKRFAVFGMGGVITVLCVLLAGRASLNAICKPYGTRWFGFGISYQNPVEEAAFIRTNLPVDRLGNDYSAGGYLLWALWPDTKVMIDPRQFPFRDWYSEYRSWSTGRNVGEFVRKYACDVWCVRYEHEGVTNWFLRSPDWKLAFYGPSAAVFVRKEKLLPPELPRTGSGIKEIKNIGQALLVLMFSVSVHDWDNAHAILASMEQRFKCPDDRVKVRAASDFLEGTLAYLRRDYEKALVHLEACRQARTIRVTPLLVTCYNHLTVLAWSSRDAQKALGVARTALALNRADPYALFNVGVLEWYLSENPETQGRRSGFGIAPGVSPLGRRPEWRPYLQAFVKRAEVSSRIKGPPVSIAQDILSGTYHRRPPLASPAEPPLLVRQAGRSG